MELDVLSGGANMSKFSAVEAFNCPTHFNLFPANFFSCWRNILGTFDLEKQERHCIQLDVG